VPDPGGGVLSRGRHGMLNLSATMRPVKDGLPLPPGIRDPRSEGF
jgi:hypothetical protein